MGTYLALAALNRVAREPLSSLVSIQETVLLYPSTGGRPKACRVLTADDETAANPVGLFGREAYAPMSWAIHARDWNPLLTGTNVAAPAAARILGLVLGRRGRTPTIGCRRRRHEIGD